MTATQSFRIYELLNAQFQQPQRAQELTQAIEAVIDEKVETGHKQFESIMKKDLEILRVDILGTMRVEMREQKSELLKTIYIVGLVQFLAIVGSVIGILSFMLRH